MEKELLRRETEEKLLSQRNEFNNYFEKQRASFSQENIRAEIRAKAELERENEDVTLRKMNLQAKLDTNRFIEGVGVLYSQAAVMFSDLATRPSEMLIVIGIFAVAAMLFYTVSEISNFFRNYLRTRLGRPVLVRETSQSWSLSRALGIRFNSNQDQRAVIINMFRDVVLPPDDMDRLIQLALSTRNTKRVGATYRHILLHGPPGTGKTLIARKLAQSSGMDYAIMSGGDVAPLGEDAVNQLHSLFRWASRSQNGLLLFIDETEAFLGSRERLMAAENAHIRHALNALLYQTGTHSNKFMLVLATNRPEELDAAIMDRLDVSMSIGLPALDQRTEMLRLYMEILTSKSSARAEKVAIFGYSTPDDIIIEEICHSDDYIRSVAEKMDGFSGREISKFVIALHHTTSLLGEKRISQSLMESILIQKIQDHQQKSIHHLGRSK